MADDPLKDSFDQGPETPWRSAGQRYTGYFVTAPRSDTPYHAPGASVTVARPMTRYSSASGDEGRDIHGDLIRYQTGDGPAGQEALFDVRHHHPYVSSMHASPQFGAHIPTLLGIAARDTRARFGEDLRSDVSLSETSSPIVHRLAEAGAVQAPQGETRNSVSRDPNFLAPTRRSHVIRKMPVEEVPRSEVSAARHFVRETLRRPKQFVEQTSAVAQEKQRKFFGDES